MTLLERQIKQTSLLNDLQHLAAMKGQIDDVPGQIHPDGAYRTQPVICRTKRHGVGLGVKLLPMPDVVPTAVLYGFGGVR